MLDKITRAIKKFSPNLKNKIVLTEAASGNYIVTPVLAALAGADVMAITKDSKYATKEKVIEDTYTLAEKLGVGHKIKIYSDKHKIAYGDIDVVTNTGFVRPINKLMIDKLPSRCVIPLMWEPWEFRQEDLDLDYCIAKGIKVYGTNERDRRLQTMKYIGLTVLYFLLNNKMSAFSTNILVIGNQSFVDAITDVLSHNDYHCKKVTDYNCPVNHTDYQAIVIAEHERKKLIIGKEKNAFIQSDSLLKNQFLIHICGQVDINGVKCKTNIKKPAKFGYMSYTADYIDSQAVIDLHTAGLKVAEGMIKANGLSLKSKEYKIFMETNYPAKAFKNEKYW